MAIRLWRIETGGGMIILGVDPGLKATGYGAIEAEGGRLQYLAAGDIRPSTKKPLAERLESIHRALSELVVRWRPGAMVLEKLYTHYEHVTTAAIMGHARGVACLVAEQHQVSLIEYPANRVKKAITGHGTASKDQVARMVRQWVHHVEPSWSFDATDALALAIAHAQMDTQHRRSEFFHVGRRRHSMRVARR